MNGIRREVEEERSLPVALNERDRLVEEDVRAVSATCIEVAVREPKRLVVPELVESLSGRGVWTVGSLAEIPLSDAGRRIASLREHVGKRDDFLRHLLGVLDGDQTVPFRCSSSRIADRVHAMARRVLPGHQAGTARRAVGRVGVGLLEQQSVIGHGVQIRGVDGLRARASKVVPPHVIDVDDDDVRLLIRFDTTDTKWC